MKKLTLLLLVVMCTTACTDSGRLERRENRIEGSWSFHKAFYKGDLALFRDNVFDDYKGDQVTFYNDGYAEYYDASLDAFFSGSWVLTLHKTVYHDGNERIYTLDMEFVDHIHREKFSFYSDAVKIGFNNLNLEVYDEHGFYTFKLNKLD